METNSNSKKRKLSQHSNGKNDGSIEAQLESLKAENTKLKQIIEKQNATIVKQALEITELDNKQSNDEDIDEDMEAEIDRLKEVELNYKQNLMQQKKTLEDEVVRLKSLIDDQADAARQKIEFRDNKISELEEQISVLKDVKVDFVTKNDTLEDERTTFQLKLNEMKEHVDQLTQKDVEWEAEADKARQMIDARDKEIEELKKQFSDANAIKNLLSSQIDGMRQSERKMSENKKKSDIEYYKKIKELEEQLKKTKNEMKQKEDSANAIISDLKKATSDKQTQRQQGKKVAAAKSLTRELEELLNVEDFWMNSCRMVCDEIFSKLPMRRLLRENEKEGEETIDKILKKFEEKKYKSPIELHAALTKLIQRNLNNYDTRRAIPLVLPALIPTLNEEFRPIIKTFTQMKNGETTNTRARRSAAVKAPSA